MDPERGSIPPALEPDVGRTRKRLGKLFAGIVIIGVGVMFLLRNIGLVDVGGIGRWWPLAFVLVGLVKLIGASSARGWVAGTFWTLFGGTLLLHTMGVIRSGLNELWPVFVILAGVNMMISTPRNRRRLSNGG